MRYTMKMKTPARALQRATVVAIAGLFAVTMVMTMATPVAAQGGPLHRLAADFDYFGFEISTTSMASGAGNIPPTVSAAGNAGDGVRIYQKAVRVQDNATILYITMSTTGDSHDGAAIQFSCLVDGAFCNPGGPGVANPPGWITLQKMTDPGFTLNCNDGGGGGGDCHDNGIHYEWCAQIEEGAQPSDPNDHLVELWMASSNGFSVFIEEAHFYIDANEITGPNPCVQAPDPDAEPDFDALDDIDDDDDGDDD